MLLAGYIIFLTVCTVVIVLAVRRAPAAEELWGEEAEWMDYDPQMREQILKHLALKENEALVPPSEEYTEETQTEAPEPMEI